MEVSYPILQEVTLQHVQITEEVLIHGMLHQQRQYQESEYLMKFNNK